MLAGVLVLGLATALTLVLDVVEGPFGRGVRAWEGFEEGFEFIHGGRVAGDVTGRQAGMSGGLRVGRQDFLRELNSSPLTLALSRVYRPGRGEGNFETAPLGGNLRGRLYYAKLARWRRAVGSNRRGSCTVRLMRPVHAGDTVQAPLFQLRLYPRLLRPLGRRLFAKGPPVGALSQG